MTLFIRGYIAASLKHIDIEAELEGVGGPLEIIQQRVEKMIESLRREESVKMRIAVKADGEPAYVVGLLYHESQTPPAVSARLATLFENQPIVQLRLKAQLSTTKYTLQGD